MARKRVALVTGASRGIGRAIAQRLLADGFDMTISARKPDTLATVADELRVLGTKIVAVPADLLLEEDVNALAEAHLANFENLDLLVLCAGVGYAGELAVQPLHRFDKQFTVNVRSPFLLVQRLLPILRSTAVLEVERGTKIVALSSITGVAAEPDLAAYGASKAALISLCESIIVSEAEHGVSATAISPGYVDTDMSGWVHDRIGADVMIRATDIAVLVLAIVQMSRFAAVPNIAVTRPGEQLWRA